jgi:GNAT superfamily N-acetyltransferase
MEIVRARPEDAAALTAIAHAAKRHWGYPEQWITAWREALTIQPDFISSNLAFSAVEENSNPVGFYVLTKENDGLHLDHLWVTPAAMGHGIGRALFRHAVDQARELRHRSFLIEADPNAEAFYKKMGAHQVSAISTEIEGRLRELPLLRYDIETIDT